MDGDDLKTMAADPSTCTDVTMPVSTLGKLESDGETATKLLAFIVGIVIAAGTTSLLPYLTNWKSQYVCFRGIAIALGSAQTIDGLMHLFPPHFYGEDHYIMCSASIFFGAGLLGIFITYI